MDFFESLELKFYDVRMAISGSSKPSEEIALVDIDDDSIDRIGRWPWARFRIAEGIRKISEGQPAIIGVNINFSEPEDSTALKEFQYLQDLLQQIITEGSESKKALLDQTLKEVKDRLDNDKKLAQAIKLSGKVVLPVYFKESKLVLDDQTPIDSNLARHALTNISNPEGLETFRASMIIMPIPAFLEGAMGVGHTNLGNDIDGKIRRERFLYRYKGAEIPSYALKIATLFLKVPNDQIKVDIGRSLTIRDIQIPLTKQSELLINFRSSSDAFKRYSFFDVITDKIPLTVFQNKIVLISPSAAGIINPLNTPQDASMSLGIFTANVIQTILDRNFIRQPSWNVVVNLIIILGIGCLISFVFTRLKALWAALTFIGVLIGLVITSIFLFVSRGLWIHMTYPILQLIFGYIGVVSLNYFITESKKEKVEGESAETNRMLGLSFQSQGMLDLAFEKFRKVPVDNEMKEVLYNLALDFERKRQYNKAANVYGYIEEHDPNYKDVAQKKQKLIQASDSMIFSDGFLTTGGTGGETVLMATGSGTRPRLGRYEIIKQLGKGAMGVVYLGQDPRINRTTAIKTFRFGADHEPEEAERLKQRFFREAESAGTLSHPNIVTIYDAGEEEDLAYIAMEYLEGSDLQKYTKKDQLLPIRRVIDIVADIADALDYAHQKGIVHRDIKPANIMLLNNGVVKITDFGIARITASSHTQTGIVKGTPHYMSPEQISGEKVDGRSDIFSLGAMMFQLLTGQVPFKGDTPAALMHQIMNVPHPDPRTLNPKIIKPLVAILDKALEKNRDNRYARASQMAEHLRILGKKIDAHMKQRKTEKQDKGKEETK